MFCNRFNGKTLLRRFVRILLLAGLLWLLFILTVRALRKTALAQIAELTNTQVKAESLDFSLNGSVLIEGLVIRPQHQRKGTRYDDAIFKAKTVYARFGIGSLLLLRPRLERITVEDFVFDVQHDLDTGLWNIAALKIKPPTGGAGKIPAIRLERGTLRYSKVSKAVFKTVAAAPLDAVLQPAEEIPNGCIFNITTAQRSTFGRSELTGSWRPGTLIITGGISSAAVGDFESAWTIDVLAAQLKYDSSSNYELKMSINDLRNKERIAGVADAFDSTAFVQKVRIFSALQKFFDRYRPWGQIDVELEAVGSLQSLSQSSLTGRVYCKDVSICDRRFQYPVEHLTGWLDFTEKHVSLNNLIGRHGSVKLSFNGWVRNFGQNRRYQIQIASDNMLLDDDLYNALSEKRKKLWSAFSPSGLAAVNYCIGRQSQTDRQKALAVKLLGVEATCRYLPYPLKNVTGKLTMTRNTVIMDDVTAVGPSETSTIRINGRITLADNAFSSAHLRLDANDIRVKGKSLIGLKAEDVTYNAADRNWLVKDFTADCYDGRVAGKFELKQLDNKDWQYLLQVGFRGIDLKRFLQDRITGDWSLVTRGSDHQIQVMSHDDHTSGKMAGSLSVVGQLGESFSSTGRCRLQITDMRLGKLSPMAKLLYVLKLTEPKDFAFDRMLVDSYIKRDRLFFHKLDLSGRALAFNGTGWMNLQNQDLDLVLTARGQRLATTQPSVLQSLGEGLGGSVLRMEIGGKLYQPDVTTRALPVITESLQILREDR